MEIFRFENPQYLFLLALIPVLLGLFWLSWRIRKIALKRFGNSVVAGSLMPGRSLRRPWIRFSLLLAGLSMLVLALADPMVGSRMQEAKREGIDVMIALDVSRSMLAEDIKPNRLERAKMAVSRLIDRLDNDRVGLVVFAGNAITQVPVTSDHSAAKMILRTVNTNSVAVQGTALGSAIERSLASFSGEKLENKVIIVISDGENHLDDPVEQARLASEQGVVIHTVGIGTPAGAPIPLYRGDQLSGFLRDNQGNTVVSRYDEATLRGIADATGGVFRHGTGSDMGLNSILDEIKKVEKDTFETMVFADYQSRYHYFVALALLFLVLEIFIFERKNKWLEKIKLFD
ncbi:MAG: VWA domain-containing protein [Bacteroides sp.]|jgi:Ca-activated chloride channel family protein|nr:VWA domain-containing protein [Bacteroides sp.]